MEGTPNLLQYIDNDDSNDHTYYGNGCYGNWGTEGEGGSEVPCASMTMDTVDNETLSIGGYFNYQAATSGSGAAVTTENANSPDTFCPLGWQLPYSGTGGDYYDKSKSWTFLFEEYSLLSDKTSADMIKSYPFSYVRSGSFEWSKGRLYSKDQHALLWSFTNYTEGLAYRLLSGEFSINSNQANAKTSGNALRCG